MALSHWYQSLQRVWLGDMFLPDSHSSVSLLSLAKCFYLIFRADLAGSFSTQRCTRMKEHFSSGKVSFSFMSGGLSRVFFNTALHANAGTLSSSGEVSFSFMSGGLVWVFFNTALKYGGFVNRSIFPSGGFSWVFFNTALHFVAIFFWRITFLN